jgi:4-cresol dehydrogenase (hydroxylating) flavoprotein subunit
LLPAGPGVSFFDLFRHLKNGGHALWMSVPGNSWGSVIGNALERGTGSTPYGDHCEQICGMEVVLPDGSIVRTGMGAMQNSGSWQSYKYGYGPGWDQMFMQSNLGVVTKAGLWLQPEPEMTARAELALPRFEDAQWAIEILSDLRRCDVIQHNIPLMTPVRAAAITSQRADWYEGTGPLPDAICETMINTLGVGWWTTTISLYGHEGVVTAQIAVVRKALEERLNRPLEFEIWHRGDPEERSAQGIPTTRALQCVNWYGGRGGHLSFAPILPQDGAFALDYAKTLKEIFDQAGQDWWAGFVIGRRHINAVNLILYNRDDPAMLTRADALYRHLLTDAARRGIGEHRGHISYMDMIAQSYDFGDGALGKLNGKVKAALDPNNIIAPGRSGVGGG